VPLSSAAARVREETTCVKPELTCRLDSPRAFTTLTQGCPEVKNRLCKLLQMKGALLQGPSVDNNNCML
jgi:hypothetical protein